MNISVLVPYWLKKINISLFCSLSPYIRKLVKRIHTQIRIKSYCMVCREKIQGNQTWIKQKLHIEYNIYYMYRERKRKAESLPQSNCQLII